MKFHNIFYYKVQILFVITVNFQKVVRYKHEISLRKDAKPNQKVELVRYNREFVVTVIVITEFDCIRLTIFATVAARSASQVPI